MPSTIAHAIAAAIPSTLAAPRSGAVARGRFALAAAFFANAPDLDVIPGFCFRAHYHEIHRWWGHNIFAGAAAIALGAWVVRKLWPELRRRSAVAWVAFWVASHWILDGLSVADAEGARVGVPLLWPLSTYQWRLPWEVFYGVPLAGDPRQILRYLTARDFWLDNFARELAGSLAFAGIVVATTFFWRRRLEGTRNDRASSSPPR